MAIIEKAGGENALSVLYYTVLAQLPDDDTPLYLAEYGFPAPRIEADTFGEFYAKRRDLQSFRLVFSRDPQLQKGVHALRAQENRNTDFEEMVKEGLDVNPIIVTHSQFPYDLPRDTKQRILWYRDGVERKDKASFLAELFLQENIGGEDFVIVSNLRSRRTIKQFDHNHVFTRIKNGPSPVV